MSKDNTDDSSKRVSLGSLRRANPKYLNNDESELRTMTEEEIRTFNDPAPGTDHGWDTMSESMKNCFRNGGHIPDPNLKTLSDLLRDREAIEIPESRTGDTIMVLIPDSNPKSFDDFKRDLEAIEMESPTLKIADDDSFK